jgi:hypothetical protein
MTGSKSFGEDGTEFSPVYSFPEKKSRWGGSWFALRRQAASNLPDGRLENLAGRLPHN